MWYTEEDKDKKKRLTLEEILELNANVTPEQLDRVDTLEDEARRAQFYEKLVNLSGKLGKLGASVASGDKGRVADASSVDYSGALSQPISQAAKSADKRVSRAMAAQSKLGELKSAKAKAEADREQKMFDRGMKEKEFGLKEKTAIRDDAKFEFTKAKTIQDFSNKLKELGIKSAAEARQGRMTNAQIENMKRDMQIKGAKLGIDKQTLALAADKFALEIYKASKEEDGKSTVAQEAVDRATAKEYSEWAGGQPQANLNKSMAQLDEVIGNLSSGDNLTGFGQNITPEFAKGVFTPRSKATRDAVWEIVQRNLREILGAQFTQKEGEMLMARAFDEALSEEENIKRVKRLRDQIKQAAGAKEQQMRYYEENGSLKGYSGPSPKDLLNLPSSQPITSNMVRVRSPDGKVRSIPSDKLDAALKAGGERVD